MAWATKKENNYKVLTTADALASKATPLSSDIIYDDISGKKLTVVVSAESGQLAAATAVANVQGSLDGTNWSLACTLGNCTIGAAAPITTPVTDAFTADLTESFFPYYKIVHNTTSQSIGTAGYIKFKIAIPV